MAVELSKEYVEAARKRGEEARASLSPQARRISDIVGTWFAKSPYIEHEDGSVTTAF